MDKKTVALIGLAFELTGLVLAGVFLGNYLDSKWDLKGLGVAGGALLALVLWITHVMKVLKEKSSDNSK